MKKLSKPVEAALAKAIGKYGTRHWEPVMLAAGFERATGQHALRPIGPASELTAEQRALAERLLERPGALVGGFPIYVATWLRKQWLGLAPPGAMFETVKVKGKNVARIELLRERARAGDLDGMWKLIDPLPLAKRVEILATMALAPFDFYIIGLDAAMARTALETLKPQKRADTSVVDFALSLYKGRFHMGERPQGDHLNAALAQMLFGMAIEGGRLPERYEGLLRLGKKQWTDRALRAIVPERRGAALAAALDRVSFGKERPRVGTAFLVDHPYPELARATLGWVQKLNNPEPALERLRPVVKKHPELASILKLGAAPTAELRVDKRLSPVTLKALRPRLRLQLEKANQLYGGHKERAKEILERPRDAMVDERIVPSTLEYRCIAGAGGPLYDAWLYMGDSGTVFKLGTTLVVAEIVQGGIECKDPELRAQLRPVLRLSLGQRGRRATAKKTSAKKSSAKKSSAKKSSAKKSSAKKCKCSWRPILT
ncbi:MAG: hypothetical protein KC776_31225 [Myxococcales bacterium]|nr:hypothetical protein [Myxococcales bacterium]MCB9580568.1 hypothetical protein [Polyangiaceae bacterium]